MTFTISGRIQPQLSLDQGHQILVKYKHENLDMGLDGEEIIIREANIVYTDQRRAQREVQADQEQ